MQNPLGLVRPYGHRGSRPFSASICTATSPVVEALETRALLSGWGNLEVHIFLPQIAPATSGDESGLGSVMQRGGGNWSGPSDDSMSEPTPEPGTGEESGGPDGSDSDDAGSGSTGGNDPEPTEDGTDADSGANGSDDAAGDATEDNSDPGETPGGSDGSADGNPGTDSSGDDTSGNDTPGDDTSSNENPADETPGDGGSDPAAGGTDASGSTPENNGNSGKKDKTAPAADISVSSVREAGDGTLNVTVVYSDNKKVKAKSIGLDDLTVSGPGGNLRVTDVSTDQRSDSKTITARYKIAAPGGSWDAADNGRYTLELGDDAVEDSSGNSIRKVSKHFDVNIAAPPADHTAPTIDLSTADVHGDENVKVVVHYTDESGIDLDTISRADLSINGAGDRIVEVGVVDVDANHDRTEVTATYHLTAPGDGWDSSDNGNYSVTVINRAVADTHGNRTSSDDGSFTVDCPAPPPIDDGFGDPDGGETPGGTNPDPGAPGGADPGTGSGGGIDATGPINFVAESVITQADGRILLAGHGKTSDGSDQAFLRRFNADGTLDLSFGSGGTVLGAVGESWYAVALQGSDRIVVAGTVGGDFAVSRYDLAGNLDASFGSAGQAIVDFRASTDIAYAAAIGANNKIVLAGASDGNAAFARLNPDGTLDDSFAQHGLNLFDLGTPNDDAAGVAVQADGRIVAAGATDSQVAVIRLGDDGEADASFSGDGLLLVSGVAAAGAVGKVDYSQGIALDGNGKILLANHSSSGDFAVTRIDINGNVDSSFGDNGVRTIDMGGDDDADAIVVQETGEVLVIGTSLVGAAARTAVAALDADGTTITSFGDNGKLLIDADLSAGAGRELHVGDLVLRAFGARQPDGKLVIGTSNGSTTTSGSATSPLRRLIVPGSTALPQGSKIGDVGIIDGANQRLQFTDDDGSIIVLTLKGGNGTVWKNGNKINLILNDSGAGLAASFKVTGGDGRISLGDVTVNGSLKSMKGKTADITGVFCTTGQIGKLTVGNIAGATLCAGGSIASIAAASISGSKILSGAALGADARLGGAGSNADQITSASIGALKVTGAITDCIIGAGLDSVDGTFIDDDDRIVGGPESIIRSLSAKGGATNSHFVAGAFGSVKTPAKVDVTADPQFQTL